MDKLVATAAEAVGDVPSSASLAVGGFGLCGIPSVLISALADTGARDFEVVSNNCGVDVWGLGLLLHQRRIRRVIASYVGENKEFARQYLAGEVEVELTPQGTLAERLRAGGRYPRLLHRDRRRYPGRRGGLPWRYRPDGSVAIASPAKATATFTVGGAERSDTWSMPSSPTSPWSGPGRGTGTATWCFTGRHGTSTRWRRWPAGSRSPRSSTSSSRRARPRRDPPARRVRPAGRGPHSRAGCGQAHRKTY